MKREEGANSAPSFFARKILGRGEAGGDLLWLCGHPGCSLGYWKKGAAPTALRPFAVVTQPLRAGLNCDAPTALDGARLWRAYCVWRCAVARGLLFSEAILESARRLWQFAQVREGVPGQPCEQNPMEEKIDLEGCLSFPV
jgi:hypothetical protein